MSQLTRPRLTPRRTALQHTSISSIVTSSGLACPHRLTPTESPTEELRRPHYCVVVFGEGIRPLRCIIKALKVRYTMFGRDGTPLRAVVNLELEEARLQSSGAGRAVNVIARLARPFA